MTLYFMCFFLCTLSATIDVKLRPQYVFLGSSVTFVFGGANVFVGHVAFWVANNTCSCENFAEYHQTHKISMIESNGVATFTFEKVSQTFYYFPRQ